MEMTPNQKKKHDLLQNNLGYFAKNCLRIKDKNGEIVPLVLNKSQEYIDRLLQKQLTDFGWVRALVLKGRQQGCSTYVGARYYHKNVYEYGKSTFILAHDGETTSKLFDMVSMYHDHSPEGLQPPLKASNQKKLIFERLESQYFVGTAGNKNVGRGGTLQRFHGSEVAFWANTSDIQKGILESVPELPGTEIILESTANGMGNMFHKKCMDAIKGRGDYILIFVPWFWQDEYRRMLPDDFVCTEEEEELKAIYGIDDEQILWRRKKVENFSSEGKAGEYEFRQEYPFTVEEAFQVSGESLIDSDSISRARKSTVTDKEAPLIMGVDPARNGDRFSITFRRGREVPKYYKWDTSIKKIKQPEAVSKIATLITKHKPAVCFIDIGNMGYGIVDRLHELGYDCVVGVNFGESATEDKIYANKRAEIWCRARDWFEDTPVSIPDEDDLHIDLTSTPQYKRTSNNRIILEPKDNIKKEYGFSPDLGDSFCLTFCEYVQKSMGKNKFTKTKKSASRLYNKKSRKSSGIIDGEY